MAAATPKETSLFERRGSFDFLCVIAVSVMGLGSVSVMGIVTSKALDAERANTQVLAQAAQSFVPIYPAAAAPSVTTAATPYPAPVTIPNPPATSGPSVEEMVALAQSQAQAAQAAYQSSPNAPQTASAYDGPTPTPVLAAPSGPTLNDLLSDPATGPQILDSLDLAAGILAPGDNDNGRPIYAFFDPRCPYCHAAYKRLNGIYPIKWIPTLALGETEDGLAQMSALIGPTEAAIENGQITSVTLTEDAERLNRLDSFMNGTFRQREQITEAQQYVVDDGLAIGLQLSEYHPEPFGVPFFIIPRPDGTAVVARGWDERNTASEVQAIYTGE